MVSNRNQETLGLLGALLFEQHSHPFSAHPSYVGLQDQLSELVNDLAFDRVAKVFLGHAEYYFQQGEWADVEPNAREVMALMGRSNELYGKAAMIRGYAHLKLGEPHAGIEYLKEVVASCAQTLLSAPLEEMKLYIEQIDAETLYQEEFLQLLYLCDSTLETLRTQTLQNEQ